MFKLKKRCHSVLAAQRKIQPNYCNMHKALVSILLESGKMKYFQGFEVTKDSGPKETKYRVTMPCEISWILLEMLHKNILKPTSIFNHLNSLSIY